MKQEPFSGVRKIQQMKSRSNSMMKKERKNSSTSGAGSARFNEDDNEAEAKKSKPNRTYQFNCGGLNDKEGGLLKGQKIEWKATFELPLEELTYPSLQRFTFDAVETKLNRDQVWLQLNLTMLIYCRSLFDV
jgi:hypothetical protein